MTAIIDWSNLTPFELNGRHFPKDVDSGKTVPFPFSIDSTIALKPSNTPSSIRTRCPGRISSGVSSESFYGSPRSRVSRLPPLLNLAIKLRPFCKECRPLGHVCSLPLPQLLDEGKPFELNRCGYVWLPYLRKCSD